MPKFCYWTVADAVAQVTQMTQTMIASARAVGVTEDFHVWTDQEIPGAICHPCGVYEKTNISLNFLRYQVQKLEGYDYFVFIDADHYFVRNPGDVTELCGTSGIFVQMISSYSRPGVQRYYYNLYQTTDLFALMRGKNVKEPYFIGGCGFFIVRKDLVEYFCATCFDFINDGFNKGYKFLLDELAISYAGHVLTNPVPNTLRKTSTTVAVDWAGVFRDVLPTNQPWHLEDWFTKVKQTINPAIIRLMESRELMIAASTMPDTFITDANLAIEKSDVQKILPVLFLAYGNFPEVTLASIQRIVSLASDEGTRLKLIVAMNSCGPETIAGLRRLVTEGKIHTLIESNENINKDPMMRIMIDLVDEPYFLWLDDDSYPTSYGWDIRILNYINAEHPFDAAGPMLVAPRIYMEGYTDFVQRRPWFDEWKIFYDVEHTLYNKNVVFPHGAFWIGNAAFVRKYNYPDREMVKRADDMLLGELIIQKGGKLNVLPSLTFRYNTRPRRGNGETTAEGFNPPEGVKPQVYASTNQITSPFFDHEYIYFKISRNISSAIRFHNREHFTLLENNIRGRCTWANNKLVLIFNDGSRDVFDVSTEKESYSGDCNIGGKGVSALFRSNAPELPQTISSSTAPPTMGIVIGTYGSVPHIHLQFENAKKLYAPCKILVVDDHSRESDALKALCDQYGHDFINAPIHYGHMRGDMFDYAQGLKWATDNGLSHVLKLSRRFIPRIDIVTESLGSIIQDFATYSNFCYWGVRTECILMNSVLWTQHCLNAIQETIDYSYRCALPDHIPEITMTRLCKRFYYRVSKVNNMALDEYQLSVHLQQKDCVIGMLRFLNHDRRYPSPNFLWRECNVEQDYADYAKSLGLPYEKRDFIVRRSSDA